MVWVFNKLLSIFKNYLSKEKENQNKHKILEIIASSIGGGASHLNYIIKYLDRNKYFIDVIMPEDGGNIINKKDVSIAGIEKGINIKGLWQLAKYINKNRYDLVHLHGFRAAFNFYLAGIFFNQDVKYVYTIHGFHTIRYKSFLRRIVQKYIDRKIINKSSKVILVSEQDKTDGLKHCMFNEKNKAIVILNGIDIDRYLVNINKDKKKSGIGIKDGEKIIGCISRLHEVKRHEYLLKAMPIIDSQVKIKLILAGQGPEKNNLEKLAKKYSVEKEVVFLGERKDVPDLLQIMDILVLLSFWEATPISLLEAMAAGVPIVASNAYGINELIEDGKTGLLVEPKNHNQLAKKIVELLEDEELKHRLIKNAKEKVKKYSAFDMVKKIEKVYEEVLGNKI